MHNGRTKLVALLSLNQKLMCKAILFAGEMTGQAYYMLFKDNVVVNTKTLEVEDDDKIAATFISHNGITWHEDLSDELLNKVEEVKKVVMGWLGCTETDAEFNMMRFYLGHMCSGDPAVCPTYICHGLAGSGKSTFVSLVRNFLGDRMFHSEVKEGIIWTPHQTERATENSILMGSWGIEFLELRSTKVYALANIKKLIEPRVPVVKGPKDIVRMPRSWNSIIFHLNGLLRLEHSEENDGDALRRMYIIPFQPRSVAQHDDQWEVLQRPGDTLIHQAASLFIAQCVRYFHSLNKHGV